MHKAVGVAAADLHAWQVRRREHLHRMADIERKAAEMHTSNATIFGQAAREAYDQGKPTSSCCLDAPCTSKSRHGVLAMHAAGEPPCP